MSKIYINNKELDADFYDADFVDRFEAATIRMRDAAEAGKHNQYKSLGDAYRAQCKIAKEYLDAIFGEGTGDDVLGTGSNIKVCMDAIAALTDASVRFRKETNDMMNKYTQRQQAANRQFQQGHKPSKH